MMVGLLLAVAAVALLLSLAASFRAPRGWIGLLVAATLASLGAAIGVLATGLPWEYRAAFRLGGEAVHLRLDGVSALFVALLAVVGGTAGAYSRGYWEAAAHPRTVSRNRWWWSTLLGLMGFVLVCSNGLHFLIGWELITLCAFFLITLDARQREVRSAGWLYLAASHAGTLALFAFFALLAGRTGSWDLGPQPDRAELAPLFWLALFGFGLKAGLFPLHLWLPSAHANAPSHVSAILSGVAIKLGIYGLVRFSGWLRVPGAAGWVLVGVGLLSAVLGVAFALGQHDLKRLLAYHSVENIGIILIGLGFALLAAAQDHAAWGALAMAGALLHVWNHGLFKALLFLGAGAVVHATGTRDMSRLGGLWRLMPWTASLFALGAVAISGLPPLNGFVSEWLIYLGLFDAAHPPGTAVLAAIPTVVLLALTGAMALACFVKVCGVVFLGAPRSEAARRADDGNPWMRGAMLVLAAGCALTGLAPLALWPGLKSAVGAWQSAWPDAAPPESLGTLSRMSAVLAIAATAAALWLWKRVHRQAHPHELTWDCGYAAPTARMQYTAGSFAGILTRWFAWILQPVRHVRAPEGPFPREARLEDHTPETVLERVVEPVARLVLQVSGFARRLQDGRVQAYLLYLLLGLGAVAVLTLAWNE